MESKDYKEEKEKEEKEKESKSDRHFLEKIIHEIRNSKTFSSEILYKMNNLDIESRLLILLSYNEMVEFYNYIVDK